MKIKEFDNFKTYKCGRCNNVMRDEYEGLGNFDCCKVCVSIDWIPITMVEEGVEHLATLKEVEKLIEKHLVNDVEVDGYCAVANIEQFAIDFQLLKKVKIKEAEKDGTQRT